MQRLIEVLKAPGSQSPITVTAPMKLVLPAGVLEDVHIASAIDDDEKLDNHSGHGLKKATLDRWLDNIVKASGSTPVFVLIVCGLLAWAFLGIPYGHSEEWPILISDIQAILCYIFDSFIMRQQFNAQQQHIRFSASLRSRHQNLKNMLLQLSCQPRVAGGAALVQESPQDTFEVEVLPECWLGWLATKASLAFGHFITLCLFWAGIFVWLGFGNYCDWSNQWQLYINSATSALMVLIFAFLAYIQEWHGTSTQKCLTRLTQIDCDLEKSLRQATNYATENSTIIVAPPSMSKIQRAIFYYADLVGTLTGIVILIIVIVVWIALGPLLSFNANWWLIIGTYAGLVGMHDGFVLRNLQKNLRMREDETFEQNKLEDIELLEILGARAHQESPVQKHSLSYRISNRISNVFSHELAVVVGLLTVVGLLVAATVMGWSTTGQLICNFPPSIIESFVMMVVLSAHNMSDGQRRDDLESFYATRVQVAKYVQQFSRHSIALSEQGKLIKILE
ncbi:hypothetical protein ACEPPN_011299 [Leptodophora sp. 'Broadleaf-Isolate-01']